MQNQTEKSKSTVVSLFGNRNTVAQNSAPQDQANEESKDSFFDAIRKNHENEERLRKERLKANQSVLKSYRIKN